MARRLPPAWAFVASVCSVALGAHPAFADRADAAAVHLRDEAIYTDYLAADFAVAETKLKGALALCKNPEDCSFLTKARLFCDLGVVEFMLQRPEEGRVQFAAALKESPSLVLDVDIATADLKREFAAVKAREAPTGATASEAPATAAPTAGGAATQTPTPATDCPPSFPGCRSDANVKECVSNDECPRGQVCSEGACAVSDAAPAQRPPYKRNWLSVAFQADALLLPSANNTCAGGTGYTCFGRNGSYYAATPLPGADDAVGGGVALATSRILVGYDRALAENVTAGARLGYAFGGGPQRPSAKGFTPTHVEVRGTYWFGDDPLGRAGLRFFLLAAAGMAEVDASIPVDVYASLQAYQNGQSQEYQAWKKTGLGFGAVGGGAMYAITPATGVALEATGLEMFPTTGTGFSLQLAYLVGL